MTGVVGPMPRQTNQRSVGRLGAGIGVSAPNPDAQPILPETGVKVELRKSPELAGQNPEVVALQVKQILKAEFTSFSEEEVTQLAKATMEAIQKVGLEPNTDITLIAREVQSTTMLFTQEAARVLMKALEKIQAVISGNSSSVQDSDTPQTSFWGPNIPSNQNPQGPVLAA